MSTLEKTWLAVVRDTNWTMALLETSGAGMSIKAFRVFEMPFADGTEFDVAVIKEWMAQHATGPSRIKITLDSAAVLTHFVELPRVSSKTLERHFKDNVTSYFDCDKNEGLPDEYIINFKIASFFQQHGHDRIRILLAALPKNLLTRVYRITARLSIDLSSINIACECFMRLFEEMKLSDLPHSAFVDLGSLLGHVFLLEKGTIVRYASVKTDLFRLFEGLKRREETEQDTPDTVSSLNNPLTQSTGAETVEKLFPIRSLGHNGDTSEIFPEFAVVSPRIGNPSLEDLFVLVKDLPFALKITARDLMRERDMATGKMVSVNETALTDESPSEEVATEVDPKDAIPEQRDQTDFLFADTEQMASLQLVYTQLTELIHDYRKGNPVNEDLNPFVKLNVTGIGRATDEFAAILKNLWQDLLPIQIGFVEGWQPALVCSEGGITDWTKHACLLGMILKTSDEFK